LPDLFVGPFVGGVAINMRAKRERPTIMPGKNTFGRNVVAIDLIVGIELVPAQIAERKIPHRL
jgi:hypothetical protein